MFYYDEDDLDFVPETEPDDDLLRDLFMEQASEWDDLERYGTYEDEAWHAHYDD